VWRFAHDENDKAIHNEIVLDVDTVLVDEMYFEKTKKEERILFFLGDADYDKIVLGNADFFKAFDMELLLGNYFFVKYEDDLEKLFSTLHEPEEYGDLIKGSSTVVTCSAQTALEVKASGGRSIYVHIANNPLYPISTLGEYGIEIIDGFNIEALQRTLATTIENTAKTVEKVDDKNIFSKL
jgi:hypothetical protein